MTYDPRATLTALKDAITAPGYFAAVQIGEPFSAPSGTTAAIFWMDLDPVQATLSGTIDVWVACVRVYARAGMTPADAESVEHSVAGGLLQVEQALTSGFTLGARVRAIDWVGEEQGHKVSVKWGHIVIDGVIMRVVDVLVPLIVDDAAQFLP